jgi:hypothetical protein
MKNFPLLCIVLLGLASLSRAQQAPGPQATPGPPPSGPLLVFAPDSAQWLISYKNNTDPVIEVPSAQTKYDQRSLVQKNGKIHHIISAFADNSRTDMWFTDAIDATVVPGQRAAVEMAGSNLHGAFIDFSRTDFPGFDWISKENYTGQQTMEGILCDVFHDGGNATLPAANARQAAGPPPIPPSGSTAYIDDKTRLPVLLQVDSKTSFYQMLAAPTTLIQLPPDIQAVSDGIVARARQATAPQAPP